MRWPAPASPALPEMAEHAIELHGVSKQYPGYAKEPGRWGWLRQRSATMDLDLEDDDEEAGEDLEDELPSESGPPRHAEDVWALRDISLSIEAGTRLAVVGQVGSGKTTFVKLLTRVLLPTEGQVVIRGRVNPLFRTIAGMMSPHDTARHNIVHIARFLRVPASLARDRTGDIAAFAELEAALDQRVTRLSPGQMQRLGIAVALHLDPDILVADESIAPGDPIFEERCYNLIREKSEAGLTTIFTSGEVDGLAANCDRAILLDEGRVVAHGPIDEVGDAMRSLPPSMLSGPAGGGLSGLGGILESVELVAGSRTNVTELTRDEAGEIRIGLRLAKAERIGLRCTIVLTGAAAVLRMTHPTPVKLEEAGNYLFTAPLPPGLLLEDTYAANVSAYDHSKGVPVRLGKVNRAFTVTVTGVGAGRPEGVRTTTELDQEWTITRPG